eukprot:TRINITY_DN22062_c0_g1_i1.p1 TRINITY_DN22062_c0_g1~~TRINITY_DN22062_c0_g1_i1.p1  ORF type:complete len:108 (+),score=11.30 TRINITY_DN22062_c0_g1_i1:171-494(+)
MNRHQIKIGVLNHDERDQHRESSTNKSKPLSYRSDPQRYDGIEDDHIEAKHHTPQLRKKVETWSKTTVETKESTTSTHMPPDHNKSSRMPIESVKSCNIENVPYVLV